MSDSMRLLVFGGVVLLVASLVLGLCLTRDCSEPTGDLRLDCVARVVACQSQCARQSRAAAIEHTTEVRAIERTAELSTDSDALVDALRDVLSDFDLETP